MHVIEVRPGTYQHDASFVTVKVKDGWVFLGNDRTDELYSETIVFPLDTLDKIVEVIRSEAIHKDID